MTCSRLLVAVLSYGTVSCNTASQGFSGHVGCCTPVTRHDAVYHVSYPLTMGGTGNEEQRGGGRGAMSSFDAIGHINSQLLHVWLIMQPALIYVVKPHEAP